MRRFCHGPGGPSKQTQLTISPQAVDNNGQLHDNNWPAPDPIVDWDWSAMNQQCNPDAIKPKPEPSALSEGLHTLLDVVGMIPVVGELADGANALIYAAEGDYVNAAMSAAAMIPLAGNVATGAKLAKRGAKLIDKVRGLKKAQKTLGKGFDLIEKGDKWAGKLQRGSTGFLGSPRLSRSQLQKFKKQAKELGAELELVKDKAILRYMDANKAQAGFMSATNKLLVRKGATYYEVAHEMTHAKHWAELGRNAYDKLTRLQKETHVYENLMKESHKLTSTEINHAVGYMNKVRRDFGLNSLF